jgi:dTMP kinase
MNLENLRGRLLEIDGPDGAGKKTQTERLLERLRSLGLEVETMSFPRYGHPAAQNIERFLRGEMGPLSEVDPYVISREYAFDRQDATPLIRVALEAGKVFVCDRFTTANAGYQGSRIGDPRERKKFFSWLITFEHVELQIPRPDLTIILHVEPAVFEKRLRARAEKGELKSGEGAPDILERNVQAQRRAAETYKAISRMFSYPMIDGSLDETTVSDRIWQVIVSHFGLE